MNYIPIPDSSQLFLWALIIGVVSIMSVFFSIGFFLEVIETNRRNLTILWSIIAVVAVTSLVTVFNMINLSEIADKEGKAAALSNIEAKYNIDTENLEEQGSSSSEGTRTFTSKTPAGIREFSVKFDDNGEPFLIINENVTEEYANSLLKK